MWADAMEEEAWVALLFETWLPLFFAPLELKGEVVVFEFLFRGKAAVDLAGDF